jgi:NADPH-dependent 2,4-dienoyl-CoA reductase/sulfur reductase-like enzyme
VTGLRHVAVVGASLAGTRAVDALRAGGFDGRITLVGAETHLPYDRPPLSKQLLTGTWPVERAQLADAHHFADLGVELHLGVAATHLDPATLQVDLAGGASLRPDAIVLATGGSARMLGTGGLAGIHTLRTLDDSLAVKEAFDARPRVVVVGAGFIGAEVASSARTLGLDVTILDPAPVPLERVLGSRLGTICAELHSDHGVHVRCGVPVAGFRGADRVREVVLGDGSTLPADLVVVGVGIVPGTGWLSASGLPIDDGVLCDEFGAVDADRRILAVGDVARRRDPATGTTVRAEHWTNAVEQARNAVGNLLAGPGNGTPYHPVPYFWSDQHGIKIQMLGRPAPGDDLEIVSGSVADRRFVGVFSRGGTPTAAVGFDSPRELAGYRRRLAGATPQAVIARTAV